MNGLIKKEKSNRAFRIKVFIPLILISIISISLYLSFLQTNIQEQRQDLLESKHAIFSAELSSYEIDQYSDAIDSFNKVLQEPNNVTAQFWKGSSLNGAGMYSNAHESFTQILQNKPNYTDALYGDGLSLYNLERYNEAIDQFDRFLAVEPSNTDALLYKGIFPSKFRQI
jgi:tetratricopeptide (TPR) repeat protein